MVLWIARYGSMYEESEVLVEDSWVHSRDVSMESQRFWLVDSCVHSRDGYIDSQRFWLQDGSMDSQIWFYV